LSSTPNTSQCSSVSDPPTKSFEELLLEKIKRSAPPAKKRKRVDTKEKVITSEEWIEAEN